MEVWDSCWSHEKSNELMIACADGVHFVRSINRIPIASRWGQYSFDWIKWAPWNRYKGPEDADGDIPEGIPIAEGAPSI